MTLDELMKRPIGTTEISPAERVSDLIFRATHSEKIRRAVKVTQFDGETPKQAMARALDYDKKRKELFAKWRNSAKQRRETSKT